MESMQGVGVREQQGAALHMIYKYNPFGDDRKSQKRSSEA
jgi:hypothetical protein